MLSTATLFALPQIAVAGQGSATAGQQQSPAAASSGETSSGAPDAAQYSEANRLLLVNPHLSNIKRPVTLTYSFKKEGTLQKDGFSDTIVLKVLKLRSDGMKAAQVRWFSGDRKKVIGNDYTDENPIIPMILQRDVMELDKLTKGHNFRWHYFQHRVKVALQTEAKVTPVTIEFEGKKIAAKKIRVAPYLTDPKRPLYPAYADEYYEFIGSKDIPGWIYQTRAVIPGKNDDGKADPKLKPGLDETVTLHKVEYQ